MRRGCLVGISLLVLLALAAGAQEDSASISGTIGGEATLLPDVATSFSLDLSFAFADFTLTSKTGIAIGAPLTGTQVFEFEWEWLTLGSELDLTLTPPAMDGMNVYVKARVFDTALGREEPTLGLTGDLAVIVDILPAPAETLATFDLTAKIGPFTATSETAVAFVPFDVQSQVFSGKWSFLEATLGKGEGAPTLSGDLGTSVTVLPDVAADLGFTFSLASAGTSITSETTFDLIPFGFASQTITLKIGFDGLLLYTWGTFTTAGLEAGIGFSFDFL